MASPHILTPHPGFAGIFPPSEPATAANPDHSNHFKVAPEFAHPDLNEDLSEGINLHDIASRNKWNALVDQARAIDMIAVAQARAANLRKSGGELVGACPVCGTGDDRFSINPRKHLFNCRGCGKGGRGPIDLEMFLSGCGFAEAVKQLTNTISFSATGAKVADIAAQRKRENEQYEAKQHRTASWLWSRRRPAAGSPVEHYLRFRGYTGEIPTLLTKRPVRKGERPIKIVVKEARP
jgi:hypothetical protein